MRSLLYSRVSTIDKGQDLERQFREMREFAEARQWQIGELYDTMSSSKDRPGLKELWKLCRARKVDVVLVHELSRFSRSLKELVTALEEFNALGIQFVSLKQQIDTTTPTGKFMFNICAAFAEMEREMIRERVKSGLDHARSKGQRLGRPRALVDRAQIDALRATGFAWREIASKFDVSVDTCKRAARIATSEQTSTQKPP